MSLDEREALHQAYSDPTYTAPTDLAHNVEYAADLDQAPVGMTYFEPPAGGRHARHAASPGIDRPGVPDGIELAAEHDADPLGGDLFGSEFYSGEPADVDAGHAGDGAPGSTATLLQAPPRRSAEREQRRRRRHRRLLLVFVVVILLVVAAAGWVGYKAISPKPIADWTGQGTGSTVIHVNPGDGASSIGTTLVTDHVVASVAAFTRAAAKNSKSADIAPGAYQLRLHMSGQAALTLLLDPAAHLVVKVTVPEGTIEKDIIAKLATALKVSVPAMTAAAGNIANLGIPDGYAPGSGPLTSAEGFLYPDTYSLDPSTKPADALQLMTSEFTTEDRAIGFADGAKALNLTPYQALIIASIAQGEVKFPTDAAMVARVILNRLAANMPLQIDATSVYGAEMQGLDPSKVTYATLDSPYNTYLHEGLPPTPIGNPGDSILKAVITPATGTWLYYVNGDAAGHLAFFTDVNQFEAAVAKCRAENWGCG